MAVMGGVCLAGTAEGDVHLWDLGTGKRRVVQALQGRQRILDIVRVPPGQTAGQGGVHEQASESNAGHDPQAECLRGGRTSERQGPWTASSYGQHRVLVVGEGGSCTMLPNNALCAMA